VAFLRDAAWLLAFVTSSDYSQFHEEVRQTSRLALLTARLWRGRAGGKILWLLGWVLCVYLAMLCAALNGQVISEWNAVCRSFVTVPASFAPTAGILSQ
jgi:hypothetical protein